LVFVLRLSWCLLQVLFGHGLRSWVLKVGARNERHN